MSFQFRKFQKIVYPFRDKLSLLDLYLFDAVAHVVPKYLLRVFLWGALWVAVFLPCSFQSGAFAGGHVLFERRESNSVAVQCLFQDVINCDAPAFIGRIGSGEFRCGTLP